MNDLLKLKWHNISHFRNYSPVVGKVKNKICIFVTGQDREAKPGRSVIRCLSAEGKRIWQRMLETDHTTTGCNVFTNLVDLNGKGKYAVNVNESWPDTGKPSLMHLLQAEDGSIIWSTEVRSRHGGNGAILVADIDGDGEQELLNGSSDCITCHRAVNGTIKWRYDDRLHICHGRTAIADIDGDRKIEIVLGSEYGNPDGSSWIAVLEANGKVRWRIDGLPGDCGSTATMLADIDDDGKLEILHTELDLCAKGPVHMSRLYCFDPWGSKRYCVDFGGHSIAIGDIDGDGVLEGVGVTTERDGGYHGRPEVVCFDLTDGKRKWATPLPRVYLSGDPAIGHLDDDGKMEIVVSTGMQSGYGHVWGEPSWGDVYVLKYNGTIVWRRTFPDLVFNAVICDVDEDGYNEVLLPGHDGYLYLFGSKGLANTSEWPLVNKNELRWSCSQ